MRERKLKWRDTAIKLIFKDMVSPFDNLPPEKMDGKKAHKSRSMQKKKKKKKGKARALRVFTCAFKY